MGEEKKGKKRNFTETIEVQITLKNYDPVRDKRFSGTFKLPSIPRPNLKCCMLGNAAHCEQADRIGIPHMSSGDDMQEKIDEVKSTIKFQMKKVMCLNVAIGNTEMEKQQIIVNTQLAANFLASLLKKQWQNIGQMYIKSTMGPPQQIFF